MNSERLADQFRTQTAAQWGLGVAAALLVLLLGVPTLLAFRAQTREITLALQHLSLLRGQGAQVPVLKARLGDLEKHTETLPGALQSKTVTLGQSLLQQSLETLLSSNGSAVHSAQILQPVQEHGFDVLGIQYDLTVPMSKLAGLCYAIESRQPFLFLTDITVGGGGEFQPKEEQEPQLEVRWIVRAYRWGGA